MQDHLSDFQWCVQDHIIHLKLKQSRSIWYDLKIFSILNRLGSYVSYAYPQTIFSFPFCHLLQIEYSGKALTGLSRYALGSMPSEVPFQDNRTQAMIPRFSSKILLDSFLNLCP